jgi:hypothetical protein
VLAVVEDDQEPALVDRVDDRLLRGHRGAVAPQRRRHRRGHRVVVVEGAQQAPAHQLRLGLRSHHLSGEPRLADPADTGHRGERAAPDQLRQAGTLALASEEGRP